MEPGVNAIAAPIVRPEVADARAVAIVSIAGPAARLTPSILLTLGPASVRPPRNSRDSGMLAGI
jgi:DNA-binding IclR family transcriptional regulator